MEEDGGDTDTFGCVAGGSACDGCDSGCCWGEWCLNGCTSCPVGAGCKGCASGGFPVGPCCRCEGTRDCLGNDDDMDDTGLLSIPPSGLSSSSAGENGGGCLGDPIPTSCCTCGLSTRYFSPYTVQCIYYNNSNLIFLLIL